MATKKQNSSNIDNLFDKPINRFIAISTVASTIFLAGYKVGDYKKDLEQKLVLLTQQQECNEDIQQEKDKCSEYRREVENRQLENLTKTVEELSKIKGGGNEK